MAPTVGLALALALASLVSFVVVQSLQRKRNTKGHPLPPGPPPLPFVGNVIGIDLDHPWFAYSRWGTEYGEIVYTRLFSQDIVIINSERVAHDLLDRRSHNYSTRPPGLVHVLDFFSHDYSTTFLPYSDKLKLHRRIFHEAFHLKAVSSFRPIQMRNTRSLILNLLTSPEVYGTHFNVFSTSIIMSIMYDYAIAPVDDPFLALVDRSLEIDIKLFRPEVAAVVTQFPILEKLPPWLPGASFVRDAIFQRTLVPMIVDMPFEHVKTNMAAGTAAPSVVSDALKRIPVKTKDEGEAAVLEKGIKESSATAYAAASGSTMSALCVFLLAMILYPEVQTRAQAEIDSIIGETLERLPDWDDRASMPYINAIILETLRWFPVAPLGVAHAAVNDDIYEGYYIPKGATIIPNAWFMARNPDKFPNPTRFIPERHMSKGPSKPGPDDISFVFGFGRRVCVGRHVVDASLFAAVVHILTVFRLERAPGWNIGPDAEGVEWTGGLTTHPVFPCIFTPRHTKERVSQLIKMQS
ncbi:cytochrome P450 [Suillus plorans]|uniref:Cytochrome P450 n=1 Tax=Suillus plorans TaxID=116603 RepID=A0A9P7AB72_9AGAM|nr:cytochrome P450 [Suillus plorans]KAG1785782.1 cytochrome P450 [Suillus plorans]